MKSIIHKLPFLVSFFAFNLTAQDTFSIVAADSTTREVGSAGASCVDLFAAGFTDNSFLGDLLPDTGAINSQAYYLPANQNNARARMRAGDTPGEIISWLASHDVQDNPAIRQYGVVGFSGTDVSAAGYTGVNTDDYKNHITGSINGIYYSIQGNILLGPQILDSMEARFRNADGDIACRLMAALQGAKVVGADTRCAPDGTSSLFSFLKVAQPSDTYGNPSFSVSLRTRDNSGIEPIDSIQSLFSAQHNCVLSATTAISDTRYLKIYPNPAKEMISIKVDPSLIGSSYSITDHSGRQMMKGILREDTTSVDIQRLVTGHYTICVGNQYTGRFIKE